MRSSQRRRRSPRSRRRSSSESEERGGGRRDDGNSGRSERREQERDGRSERSRLLRGPIAQVRHGKGEEQRGERRVESEFVRVLEYSPDRGADGGAHDPEDVEESPRSDQDRPLESSVSSGERPRLVDDRLRLDGAPQPPP